MNNWLGYGWKAYYLAPPAVRHLLKKLLKRGAGHKSSAFDGAIARRDANGKCRIDRASRTFCDYLNASGISDIEGKRCLEIGTGYVGSSAIVMWLLGAKAVTSIDLNRIFNSGALKESILSADRDRLFVELKEHVESEGSLKARIDLVYEWAGTADGNIAYYFDYLAPFDLLKDHVNGEFDFLYSVSTLEHIPRSIADRFLEKTSAVLVDGGMSLHFVDLTDHYDQSMNPFDFLTLERGRYSEDDEADSRGNRIRASEWLRMSSATGLICDIVLTQCAPRALLPKALVDPFNAMSEEELLVTSILLRGYKRTCGQTEPVSGPADIGRE